MPHLRRLPVRLLAFALAFILAFTAACSPAAPPPAQRMAPALRTPANVFGHEHADWLEREDRVAKEKPEEVIRAMGLKDGDAVADIGAGTGFFSRRLARAVAPGGTVYAEEIQPEMLDLLKKHAQEAGIANIVTVLGTATDPKLPAGQMDWILLVDVYHELQQPQAMLAKIRQALKPGGRVALVEYRAEDKSASGISSPHRMTVEQVLREWTPAGFELVQRIETLPTQHLLIFRAR